MNKYKISWLFLEPLKGKATKRDAKIFNSTSKYKIFSLNIFNNYILAHFPTKEEAEKMRDKLHKANKDYKAIIITDAQFGNIKIDYKNEAYNVPFTKMQLENAKIV